MRDVIGYVRVSTDEQAHEGVSLDAQTAKIKSYCDFSDFTLRAVVRDEGRTGKTTDRAGLQEVMRAVEAGEVSAVVVYKLDRLSRSVIDTLQLIEAMEARGVAFHSIQEKVDTKSAIGRFFLTILAAFAQMERDLISERTSLALQHKKSQGQHVGTIPYGYRIDKAGKLASDSREADVIRQARELRAAGRTLQQIANDLNARGVKTKRGGLWYPTTVKNAIER
jgi:site-specific DNA recombinase